MEELIHHVERGSNENRARSMASIGTSATSKLRYRDADWLTLPVTLLFKPYGPPLELSNGRLITSNWGKHVGVDFFLAQGPVVDPHLVDDAIEIKTAGASPNIHTRRRIKLGGWDRISQHAIVQLTINIDV